MSRALREQFGSSQVGSGMVLGRACEVAARVEIDDYIRVFRDGELIAERVNPTVGDLAVASERMEELNDN